MVVRLGARRLTCAVSSITGSDVRLHPDDRLDLGLFRLLLELPRGVEVTVVGNRERRLLELAGARDQALDPVGAVEKRVLGVTMEVYERHRREDSDARRVTQS